MKLPAVRDLVPMEMIFLSLYTKEIVLIRVSPLGELSPFGTIRCITIALNICFGLIELMGLFWWLDGKTVSHSVMPDSL